MTEATTDRTERDVNILAGYADRVCNEQGYDAVIVIGIMRESEHTVIGGAGVTPELTRHVLKACLENVDQVHDVEIGSA
jgi:hypothetical protein